MTNAHKHIARTRRLVLVATSIATLGGFGVVAVKSADSAGTNAAPACAPISATPTASPLPPGRAHCS